MTKEDQFIKFFQEASEDRKQYRRDVVAIHEENKENMKVLLGRFESMEKKWKQHDEKLDTIIETVGEIKVELIK
ncbi:MAG: hypothetical protein AAB589_00165 [Patescibacteria group bacterium]